MVDFRQQLCTAHASNDDSATLHNLKQCPSGDPSPEKYPSNPRQNGV